MRKVLALNINSGFAETAVVFHWYYDQNRKLVGIWGQEVMQSAMNNYEYVKPLGFKIKYSPCQGAVQEEITDGFMVADSNSDLAGLGALDQYSAR